MSAFADAVLFIHFGLACFISFGFIAIWLGIWCDWRWVRNRSFRLLHMLAIGIVAVEGLLGIACPLTAWENWLRQDAGERSFVARWVQELLYYDFPEWAFTALYVAMAALTAFAWVLAPPRRR